MSKEIVCQKLSKNNLSPKNFVLKKCCVKKISVQQNLGPKIFDVKNLVKKIVGPNNWQAGIFPTNFVRRKFSKSEEILGNKN